MQVSPPTVPTMASKSLITILGNLRAQVNFNPNLVNLIVLKESQNLKPDMNQISHMKPAGMDLLTLSRSGQAPVSGQVSAALFRSSEKILNISIFLI